MHTEFTMQVHRLIVIPVHTIAISLLIFKLSYTMEHIRPKIKKSKNELLRVRIRSAMIYIQFSWWGHCQAKPGLQEVV